MKRFIILFTALSACSMACGQSPKTATTDMRKTDNRVENHSDTGGCTKFIANFKSYRFDIQAAGIATLPKASLNEKGILEIEYAYHADGENRTGSMKLTETKPNHFEGSWKTNADNGHVYAGNLYLDFVTNGTAIGFYTFAGSNYKITLFIENDKN